MPPAGAEPPSVLRGSIVRFVSQGRHRLDRVVGTRLDAGGELVLSLQASRTARPACWVLSPLRA